MLRKIIIENFKGIRHQEISLKEKTLISGTNETGKSTIEDAFLWCMTGKDKRGRQNADIRHYNMPELDPCVTLGFTTISFRRTFKQTKSGGNTTVYEVNRGLGFDVINMTDTNEKGEMVKGYNTYVQELFPEFRLCSDIFYLAESMEKEEARKLVLKHGGKPEDEEILSHLEIEDQNILKSILENYGANEALRMLKKTTKEKDDELKKLKGELEGRQKDIAELTPKSEKSKLEANLKKTLENIKSLEEALKNLEVGSDLREDIIRAKDEKAKAA